MTADEPTSETDEPDNEPPAEKPNDVKAMEAALRKANREAAEARKKLKELEDKDKPEVERLSRRVSELESELSATTGRLMRAEVAIDKGLTKTQARRLVGDTEEELTADADDLLASFKPSDDGSSTPAPSKPTEALKGGVDPTDDTPQVNIREVVDAIPRGL